MDVSSRNSTSSITIAYKFPYVIQGKLPWQDGKVEILSRKKRVGMLVVSNP